MSARPMVCTCRIEGTTAVETARLAAMQTLGLDRMGDLTTSVVLSLAFDFAASTRIVADQWFGVEVTAPSHEPMWIECDDPADGLLYLWAELAKKEPWKVTQQRPSSRGHAAAIRTSNWHIGLLQSVYDHVHEHRKEQHGGQYDDACKICRDCIDIGASVRIAMNHAWGTAALDEATGAAVEDVR